MLVFLTQSIPKDTIHVRHLKDAANTTVEKQAAGPEFPRKQL